MKKEKEYPVYPPLFFVRITEKLRSFFLRLNRQFTHPNVVIWEMVHNFWVAAGIGVVAELGIAELLQKGALSIEELAERTGSHADSLYRVMRMLASQGIFRETGHRIFRSTTLSKPLEEEQIRHLILVHVTPQHFQMFGELLHTVRIGENSSRNLTGSELFARIGSDTEKNEKFNLAMTSATRMQVSILIPAFHFHKYPKIIDLGGGQGLFLASLLHHYTQNTGLVFDLPQALVRSEEVISEYGLEKRMESYGGDFFEEVPGGADLYMMKSVLHDWDDEAAGKILHNLHRAMEREARLLVIESVIEEGNKPSFGKMTDILMMVSAGGRERTKAEFEALLRSSGFRICKIHPTISPLSLIEAEKI